MFSFDSRCWDLSPHICGCLGQVGVDNPERESHPLERLHGVLVRDIVSGVDDADSLAPINTKGCPQNVDAGPAFVPSNWWFALKIELYYSFNTRWRANPSFV